MDFMAIMTELGKFIGPLLEAYAGDYGFAVQAVAYVGTFRLVFKPVMAGIEQAVKDTETQKDDEVLSKVQGNVIYKGAIFLVDLLASIKLKPKTPKV